MGKIEVYSLDRKKQLELERELWSTLDQMKSKGAQRIFLNKLFTDSEEIMFARRILIARLLLRGLSKQKVQQKLGVGQATVDSVAKWVREDLSREEREVLKRS
jgi:Trp operon repressor